MIGGQMNQPKNFSLFFHIDDIKFSLIDIHILIIQKENQKWRSWNFQRGGVFWGWMNQPLILFYLDDVLIVSLIAFHVVIVTVDNCGS